MNVEGEAEAPSKFALADMLKKDGLSLITASEEKQTSALSRFNITIGGVKLAEKIAFAKNLATMVDAGLSLSRALTVMQTQTKSKVFQNVLTDVVAIVEKGESLSSALGKHPKVFSMLFISMVRAGEESGTLSSSLRVVAEQMDRSYKLRRKIRGAMMYPGIVISAMIVIGILMLMFVVPTLTQTFAELNVPLPYTTRVIIGSSNFFTRYPVVLIGGIIALVALVIGLLHTSGGKRAFEWGILHMPIISPLVKQTNAARMTRTLASLLVSGVEVVTALSITRDVMQNSYYKAVLTDAEQAIQKGLPLSGVLRSYEHLFPPMVVEMASVGEETGSLPDLLLQIAMFYEDEVQEKTKDMSTIIEPILMVIIGGAVGLFAYSMITPIYSISTGI